MELKLYFDGACEPVNPGGEGTYGYHLNFSDNEIVEGYGSIGEGEGITNNVAEWEAVRHALLKLKSLNKIVTLITIHGDSMLVVNQLNRKWACNAVHLLPIIDDCRKLLNEFNCKWSAEWIPREKNNQADNLSRMAYEKKNKKSDHAERIRNLSPIEKIQFLVGRSKMKVHDKNEIFKALLTVQSQVCEK